MATLHHGENEIEPAARLHELKTRKYNKDKRNKPEYFDLAEPGLVHPWNTSIVKVRDSGVIDVFVSTDNGIRIDPNAKSINVIGSHLKEHIGIYKSWISKSAQIEVKGPWTLNAIDINLNAKGTIKMNAKAIDISTGKFKASADQYDWY